jgi:two-component system response regulator HydG
MKQRTLLVFLALALAFGVLTAFLPPPLDAVENQVTSLKYVLRGALKPDSSVVLVYIDESSARALGWPLRRNFYALMVKILTELHVRAVGVETMFEDQSLEYPEYDELLAGVITRARNVVLTSYFDRVGPDHGGDSLLTRFVFPAVRSPLLKAEGLHLPFASLLGSAAGCGHLNFVGDHDVPAFLLGGSRTVPAFGMELVRVAMGADQMDVAMEGSVIQVAGKRGSVVFSTGRDGVASLNFPGKMNVFPIYPFIEVLRSYDALRTEKMPSVPLAAFQGKIVLLGIIAEGRSQFYDTPVDPRYPSLGLHATFVDNALQNRFLTAPPFWESALAAVIFAIGVAATVFFVRRPALSLIGELLGVVLVCLALFSLWAVNLAVTPFVVTAVAVGGLAQVLRHREARHQVSVLEKEKQRVLGQLHDREAKVAFLERELLNAQEERTADRTEELLEEIRRYKTEIRALSSRADDMEEYRQGDAEEKRGVGNFEGLLFDPAGPMRPVIEFVEKIASSDAAVLILGESGTGKELVARAIHKRSKRAAGPFVAVNCGALSEGLLESELFGHERGAFTGAVKDRLGRFEMADGGTIFLDEIGEVSEAFQVKLLRVLQEGEFERVGGTKTLRVNVRVVAATNKDLKEVVKAGSFRQDLYYRLNGLTVALPPLRERPKDIPLLVREFLGREGQELRLSKNVMDAIGQFPWRGNVRELESVLKRAALLARAEGRTMVTVGDLTEEVVASAREAVAVEEQILESLREKKFSRSSISETAEELGGLNRGTVAEYLRGECLKAFVEHSYELDRTVRHLALSADRTVLDRVTRKMEEYLQNLVEVIDPSEPWEVARTSLRPKTKNLPQRYHPFLESVAEAYYRGIWKL